METPDPGRSVRELRVDWPEYHRLIEQLALQIRRSGYEFDSLICLSRGGLRPGDVISRIFRRPLAVLSVSSYREAAGRQRGALQIATSISSVQPQLQGRVLLVDDLADSGDTLAAVVQHLREQFAAISELRTAVIWLKGCSRFQPDYFAAHLADSPWIRQPFEVYDGLDPHDLAQQRAGSSGPPNPAAPTELSRFAFLIGTWRCEARLGTAEGQWQTLPATWLGHFILDGHAIADEYRMTDASGKLIVFGMNFRTYDPARQAWNIKWLNALAGTWIDLGTDELGGVRFDGQSVVYAFKEPVAAHAYTRATYTNISGDHFTWRGEKSEDAKTWSDFMVIEAHRSAD